MKNLIYVYKKTVAVLRTNNKIIKTVVILNIFTILEYIIILLNPFIMQALLNGAVSILGTTPNYFLLNCALLGLLISAIFYFIYYTFKSPLWVKIDTIIKNQIICDILKKISKIKYEYFNSSSIYEKIILVKEEMPSFASSQLISSPIITIFMSAFSLIVISVTIAKINLILLILILMSNIFKIFVMLCNLNDNYFLKVQQLPIRRWAGVYESIITTRTYLKEVRFFNLKNYILKKYREKQNNIRKSNIKFAVKYSILDFILDIVQYSIVLCALLLTVKIILDGEQEIGAFLLVYESAFLLSGRMYDMINTIGDVKKNLKYVKTWEEIDKLGDVEVEEKDYCEKSIEKLNIVFKNVSFRYPEMTEYALKDINIEINQGEKIAVVGANGSGKTTFVSLINALFEPTKGQILINGDNLKNNIGLLRRYAVILFQDYGKYEFTIDENIRLGNLHRELYEEDIVSAASQSGASEFIDKKIKKYETEIGTVLGDGVNLSEGEWQKLALARLYVRKEAKIVIMDEPTAALDAISESNLYKNFLNSSVGVTKIIISHRLSITNQVDRILVFDGGKIIEEGNHDDLIHQQGVYYRMYKAQAEMYI